jgi:hypothetical protein
MAKFIVTAAMDAELAYIRDNSGTICICNAQPTTVAQATTAANYSLGTAAYGTAGWTIAQGDAGAGSRKITTAGTNVVVSTSGTVNHIAWIGAGTVIAVGTCTATAVTAAGTMTVNAFDLNEIGIIS